MCGERCLWLEVIAQHMRDACFFGKIKDEICRKNTNAVFTVNLTRAKLEQSMAGRKFFDAQNKQFLHVCTMAQLDPQWVVKHINSVIAFQDAHTRLVYRLADETKVSSRQGLIAARCRNKNMRKRIGVWHGHGFPHIEIVPCKTKQETCQK